MHPPRAPNIAPEPRDAALLIAAVMALTLLVGYPLQSISLLGGVLVTEWLLLAAPVFLLIRWRGLPRRSVLMWHRPSRRAIAGALVAGVSGWYVVGNLVETLQSRFLPIPPDLQQAMQQLVSGAGRPLVLDLVALALSPAICEELLFRGFVLRATARHWPLPLAVAVNALAFAAFHLSIYRFLATALLGLVLALLAHRSRSIVPAMLFHMLNNAATLLAGRYLGAVEGGLSVRPVYLAGAAATFAFGLLLALLPRARVDGQTVGSSTQIR